MTDSAALIEDLTHLEEGMIGPPYHHDEDAKIVRRAIDALSRLTAPPPDEIAGLVERLEHPMWVHHNDGRATLEKDAGVSDMKEAAAALRALAQEIERLKYLRTTNADVINKLGARIRELEGALSRLTAPLAGQLDIPQEVRDRDAAIGRLTAPPPDEIAGLIARLELENPRLDNAITLYGQAAIALRTMAQEIARLEAELKFALTAHDGQVQDKDTIAGWLAKAEAERDAIKEERDSWKEEHGKLLDDTADYISDSAIRRKTIEDAEAAINECESWDEDGEDVIWKKMAVQNIHALAHSESEGKAESKE